MVLTKPYVLINAVDLSSKVRSVDLSDDIDILDATAGNAAGAKSVEGGLTSWSATITFLQDYTGGSVDATLFAAHGTLVSCEFRGKTDAVSATNPKFTGTALVKYDKPIGGQVGQELETTVTLTGSGALARATS
jgi:hypothetical protein